MLTTASASPCSPGNSRDRIALRQALDKLTPKQRAVIPRRVLPGAAAG
ncbi:hypothetical protein [Nonomuraea sp. B5E05]